MKIHPLIASFFLTASLGLQGWILFEISALQVNVARLEARVDFMTGSTRQLTIK